MSEILLGGGLAPYRDVLIDADLLQQALDYLTVSHGEVVRLMVANDRCIGIATGKRAPLVAQARLMPAPVLSLPAPNRLTLKTITKDMVLAVFSADPIRTLIVADKLGIDRKDTQLRSKVTKLVADLREEGAVRRAHGKPNFYVRSAVRPLVKAPQKKRVKAPQKKVAAKSKVTRKDVTEDSILAQMRKHTGPMISMMISDSFGIPHGASSVRTKVSELLLAMRTSGVIKEMPQKTKGHRAYVISQDAS